jgi:hypothetical protein
MVLILFREQVVPCGPAHLDDGEDVLECAQRPPRVPCGTHGGLANACTRSTKGGQRCFVNCYQFSKDAL